MRRLLSRTAALAAAVLSVLLILSPLMLATAQTAQVAEDVEMYDEAWFFRYRQPLEPVPDVDDPAGASGIPKAEVRNRTNPYPLETLHVGIASGEVEAVTFVTFPLHELTDDGNPPMVTGGTLTLVDGGSGNGSKRADSAEMIACLTKEFVVAAQGGDWKDVPEYDCATRATAVLVEGSQPLTWTVDLAPFASAWADPLTNYGVALVPDPDSARPAPDQSWHVSFQANSWQPPEPSPRDEISPPPDRAPITANLRFVAVEQPSFGGEGGGESGEYVDPEVVSEGGGFSAGPGFSDGFDDGADGEIAPPPAVDDVDPVVGGGETAPPVTRDERRGVRTNPAVYLLPFLGLGLAGLLGYSLSHDPELPTEREGAVSKLMARRRAGLR